MSTKWTFYVYLMFFGMCALCDVATSVAADVAPHVMAVDVANSVNGVNGVAAGFVDGEERPEVCSLRESATLRDVCFVDDRYGWAVGDSGTILGTTDGGKTWRFQESGTMTTLTTVAFVDRQRGWVGGRISAPGTHESVGILLTTENGGATWVTSSHPLAPIARLRFSSVRAGFAIGTPGPGYPTGILESDSGGRGWNRYGREAVRSGYIDGDFRPLTTEQGSEWFGIVCSVQGIAAVSPREIRFAEITDTTQTALLSQSSSVAQILPNGIPRAVTFDTQTSSAQDALPIAWCVGDNGFIVRSDDLGFHWRRPNLPQGMESTDFRTVAVRGDCVVATGLTGEFWRSMDGGETWRAIPWSPSDVRLPLYRVVSLGDHRLVAVGSLGVILCSEDDGATWIVVRGQRRRATVLATAESVERIPWEPIVDLTGRGYHVAIVLREDLSKTFDQRDSTVRSAARDRAIEIAASLGADLVHATVVPSSEVSSNTPVASFGVSSVSGVSNLSDVSSDVGSSDVPTHIPSPLESHRQWLATQIRLWRPSMVLMVPDSAAFRQLVPEAITLAESTIGSTNATTSSDTAHDPDSLPPWTVPQLLVVIDDPIYVDHPSPGDLAVDLSRYQFRFGKTTFAASATARATIGQCYPETLPTKVLCRPLISGGVISNRSEFPGPISERSGDGGRSTWNDGVRDDPESAVRRISLQRAEQTLRSLETTGLAGMDGFIRTELPSMMESLGPEAGTAIAMVAVQTAFREGLNGAGIRLLERITELFPESIVSTAAMEALWPRLYGDEIVDRNEPDVAVRLHKAEQWLTKLRNRPIDPANPHGIFLQASIERRAGDIAAATKLFRTLTDAEIDDPWSRDAFFELRRLSSESNATSKKPLKPIETPKSPKTPNDMSFQEQIGIPEPIGGSGRIEPLESTAPTEPILVVATDWRTDPTNLDGIPDVPESGVWIPLHPTSEVPALTRVRFSRDEEYLYLSIEMAEISGQNYTKLAGVRTRDAQLRTRDRVEIDLDVDRDRTTWYRLTLDARGQTREEATNDPSWNPQWYVASSAHPPKNPPLSVPASVDPPLSVRTLEAAIPLCEFGAAAQRLAQNGEDYWYVTLRRVVPAAATFSSDSPRTASISFAIKL